MNEILVASPARWLAALVFICPITAAKGQGLAAAQSPATAVDQAALQAKPAASENDAMLAKAGKLYYSTTKLGLSALLAVCVQIGTRSLPAPSPAPWSRPTIRAWCY